MCFAIACFAQPAIAAPIESPPRAAPAQENLSELAKSFSFAQAAEKSCAWQPITAPSHEYAILANYKVIDTPAAIYQRCLEIAPIAFRALVDLRQMDTGPPGK